MAQIPVCEKAFLFCLRKEVWAHSHACRKPRPLHTGVGVNLILPAPRHAFQTQSVAFVRLGGSGRHDKQGSNWNLWGWWVDFTAFLWLSVMTVKMGALEGVFDVFVLFRAGSGSPLHALMSCCGVWCWPSNLLWRSGPGVHPAILPLSHTQLHPFTRANTHTHTQSASHAGGCSLIYIASRKRGASLSCCALSMMKWGKNVYVCCLCFWDWRKTGGGTSLRVCMHVCVYVYWRGKKQQIKLSNNKNLDIFCPFFDIIWLYSPFFCPSSTKMPNHPKNTHTHTFLFRQPAWPSKCTIALLCELSCFPVC